MLVTMQVLCKNTRPFYVTYKRGFVFTREPGRRGGVGGLPPDGLEGAAVVPGADHTPGDDGTNRGAGGLAGAAVCLQDVSDAANQVRLVRY